MLFVIVRHVANAALIYNHHFATL